MRQIREILIWAVVVAAVSGVIYAHSGPTGVEALALAQTCHRPGRAADCRICGGQKPLLPYVIDENTVQCTLPPGGLAFRAATR